MFLMLYKFSLLEQKDQYFLFIIVLLGLITGLEPVSSRSKSRVLCH